MTYEELKAEADRQGYILVKIEIPKLDTLYVDTYGRPVNIEPNRELQDLIHTVEEKTLEWHLEHARMGFLDPIAECYNALNTLDVLEDEDDVD